MLFRSMNLFQRNNNKEYFFQNNNLNMNNPYMNNITNNNFLNNNLLNNMNIVNCNNSNTNSINNSINNNNINLNNLNQNFNLMMPNLNNINNINNINNNQNIYNCSKSEGVAKDNVDSPKNIIHLDNILKSKDKRTTLIIRNIPNRYTISLLLNEINQNYYRKYDIVYLPQDCINNSNLGFGFINFLEHMYLIMF